MTGYTEARAILDEARANMALSLAKAGRRSPIRREAVTTPALPAMPAPETKVKAEAQPQVPVDLTAISAFTAKMLSAHTGVSMRSVREAIRGEQIRTTRQGKGPRLLNVVDTVRWLQAKHSVTPMALLDICLQEPCS
jgi:hypothetical protein